MSLSSLALLSVGLSMDATAVAAARGMRLQRVRTGELLAVALVFGAFQAAMPVVGYLAGDALGGHLAAWDHWIAFALLGGIGIKMILEARGGPGRDDEAATGAPLAVRALVLLGLATSIDAMAAGVTLPAMGLRLLPAILAIGVTTAVLSGVGLLAGRRIGRVLGRSLPALGGIVLLLLGARILIEHLTAGI